MVVDVTATIGDIDFMPNDLLTEIIQNVKTIITTTKGTVPMDRDFGIKVTALDKPIAAAQAILSSEIVSAINRFEPRAKVTKIIYQGREQDGVLEPTVRIEVIDNGV